jgi:hypothetical protein
VAILSDGGGGDRAGLEGVFVRFVRVGWEEDFFVAEGGGVSSMMALESAIAGKWVKEL